MKKIKNYFGGKYEMNSSRVKNYDKPCVGHDRIALDSLFICY